jgi:lipid II:glycine glycyltransferase (peptidoglycan interpeptide bridge formation enzyme)
MVNRFVVDKFTAEEWSKCGNLLSCNNIYQTWSYGAAHCKKPFYSVSRAILFQGDRPLVMAQFRIAKIPGFRLGFATCQWGPLWPSDEDENITEAFLSEFLTKVIDEYSKKRGLSIRFDLHSTFREDKDAHLTNVFKKNGFKYDSQTRRYRTYILDLSLDCNELRSRFHSEWRRRLRISEKVGFYIEWGSNVEMFDRFRRVYDEMWAHKTFATGIDMDMIRETVKIAKPEEGFLISVVKHEDKDVCAHVDSCLGNTMYSFLGATSPQERKNTNPGYLIRWEALQKAKAMGLRWYDLGGVTDIPSGVSLDEYKKRMNGQYIMNPGRFELRYSGALGKISDLGIKYIQEIRKRI